jgi:hypothetical protein
MRNNIPEILAEVARQMQQIQVAEQTPGQYDAAARS